MWNSHGTSSGFEYTQTKSTICIFFTTMVRRRHFFSLPFLLLSLSLLLLLLLLSLLLLFLLLWLFLFLLLFALFSVCSFALQHLPIRFLTIPSCSILYRISHDKNSFWWWNSSQYSSQEYIQWWHCMSLGWILKWNAMEKQCWWPIWMHMSWAHQSNLFECFPLWQYDV